MYHLNITLVVLFYDNILSFSIKCLILRPKTEQKILFQIIVGKIQCPNTALIRLHLLPKGLLDFSYFQNFPYRVQCRLF